VPATLPSCTGMLNATKRPAADPAASACSSVLPRPHRQLKREPRPLLPRHVFDRFVLAGSSAGAAAPPSIVKMTSPTLTFCPL